MNVKKMRPHLETLREYWAIIMGAVGLIVWAVRVEARTHANQHEIKSLWRQRDEDMESHRKARDETNSMLAEIRRDIKSILARGAD